jgi:hypothetical protein
LDDFCACEENLKSFKFISSMLSNHSMGDLEVDVFQCKEDKINLILLYICRVSTRLENFLKKEGILGKSGILLFPSINRSGDSQMQARGTLRYFSLEMKGLENKKLDNLKRSCVVFWNSSQDLKNIFKVNYLQK